ncbi:hypothetical protein BH20ACT24_BH20ACT24_00740 [soil metagenome]
MDEQRFEQLERKRDSEGLSDEEADELGRMMAERAGKPYANAEDRPSLQDEPVAWEEEAKREEEAGEDASGSTDPDDLRLSDTERPPVAPGGSGYLPPKGGAEDPAP